MILVYDVTNRRSLDHLDTWLAELSKYDGEEGQVGMVKVVVGNKVDQLNKKMVRVEEGRQWAEERGFQFIGMSKLLCIILKCHHLETSAKSQQGVDLVFTALVDQILQYPQLWEQDTKDTHDKDNLVLGSSQQRNSGRRGQQNGCC